VPSEISQASTEFRSTGRISTTRMRPSTVARPGLASDPMGVMPGDSWPEPGAWPAFAPARARGGADRGHPDGGPPSAPCLSATSASPDLMFSPALVSAASLAAWRSWSTRTRLSTS
jgi:hypothetical protein